MQQQAAEPMTSGFVESKIGEVFEPLSVLLHY
jgi:hypothetical protein